MHTGLISVIVPVYKVEKYLDRCVESIVRQTYKNLEIILVNDGSPDNCPNKCECWAKKDSRIKVIHKENGGLSDARNKGITVANGRYIAFVDSDDWIEPTMYEELYNCIIETKSDICSCDAIRVWEDETPSKRMQAVSGNHILNTKQAMEALINSTFLIQTVWNKLYKTELVRDIPFEKGKIHEDEYWSWQVIAKAKRVATIDKALYNYAQRKGSIMGDGYTGKSMLVIEAKEKRHQYIKIHLPELEDIDNLDFLYTCYYHGCQILKFENKDKKNEYIAQLKVLLSKRNISKKYMKQFSAIKRIRISLIKRNLLIACKLDILLGIV